MKANKNIFITEAIVEIFRTNVVNQLVANNVVSGLNQLYPDYRINFDLEDCDKVLRIESYTSIDVLGIVNYGKLNKVEIILIDY